MTKSIVPAENKMEEKKYENRAAEIRDEELDKVSGGIIPDPQAPLWYANGDEKEWCKCWVCERYYLYAPGLNKSNPNDPYRHFCSEECKKKHERKLLR